MSFEPQYGFWAKDDLASTGNAIYSHPDNFKIAGGMTVLLPDNYTGSTVSYNGGPWLKPEYWCIDSPLDTWADLNDDLGYYTGATGTVGFEGSVAGMAVETRLASLATGSWAVGEYAYPTGGAPTDQAGACIGIGHVGTTDWPCPAGGSAGAGRKQTYEFDIRAFAGAGTNLQDTDGIGLTGALYPSFFASNTNTKAGKDEFVIVEPRADGIRVHGQSGAFLPANMTGASRKVRVAIDWGATAKGTAATDVIVALDDGSTMYVPDCGRLVDFSATHHTAIFGCPPLFGGNDGPTFTTSQGSSTFFNLAEIHDPLGQTGIVGFSGVALWDNIKCNLTSLVVHEPENVFPTYNNVTTASITTDSWRPNPDMGQYVGAWIGMLPGSGTSKLDITVEQKRPVNEYGGDEWAGTKVETLTISGVGATTTPAGMLDVQFMDLSSVPIYPPPFENELRFVITATPGGFQPPAVDEITVVGNQPVKDAKFHPNWKLSSLPQEIQVSVNEEGFYSKPSPKHHHDDVFFNNVTGRSTLALGEKIDGGDLSGHVTGTVFSDLFSTANGFELTQQGFYDTPAWKNFTHIGDFTGQWSTNTYSYLNTGAFEGDLIDVYSYYPVNADEFPDQGTSGMATVKLTVGEYEDLNGALLNAQIVEVASYTGDGSNTMGIRLDTIGLPTGSTSVIGVVEGTIQIDQGPGVWATIHEENAQYRYYLDGSDYREPGTFGIAAFMTGDRTTPTTGVFVSFAVDQRSGLALGLDANNWSGWTDKITPHATDRFVLYGVSGYLADHSYMVFSGISGYHARGTDLDDTLAIHSGNTFSTFTDIVYDRVKSDSFLFETWIKPYGFTGSEATSGQLLSCGNASFDASDHFGRTELWVHEDGHLEGLTQLAVSKASMGEQETYDPMGIRHNYLTGNIFAYTHKIDGTDNGRVIWGEWNHIGFAMEQLAMGDTFSGANQPLLVGDGEQVTHGARSSKVYITVNGKVAGAIEVGPDTHENRFGMFAGTKHGILPYSNEDAAAHAFPTINMWSPCFSFAEYTDRELVLGKDMIAEWDHFRFGARERVDLYSDVIVKGAKAHPPTFTPYDALKVPEPSPGVFSHMEFAHVYRLDYGTEYPFWDEGYSPTHMQIKDVALVDGEIDGYGMSKRDFIAEVDGPKGRPAVRLGPGASLDIPLSRWDERAYNGSGSYSHKTATQVRSASIIAAGKQLNDVYDKTNSNSRFVWGAHIKPYKYPDQGRIMDLFTLDEYSETSSYGDSQVYIGVDHTGALVCGTRRAYVDNGTLQIGPFTGGYVPLNEWSHIGLDADLHLNANGTVDPQISMYLSGAQIFSQDLTLTTAGAAGAAFGRPFAMETDLNDHGMARVGGVGPIGVTDQTWRYDYGDFAISEMLFGYKCPDGDSQIDFARLGSASGVAITGHGEKAFIDFSSEVGKIYGTGNAFASPQTGGFVYPATDFSGAGQKLMWVTAAGGNSWEGLLKGGMALFGDGTFMNAHSYYAIYPDSEAEKTIGGVDSPIQFVNRVPDHGVNLALITTKDWDSESAVSSFDLSDDNFANITFQVNGDNTAEGFELITQDVEPNPETNWNALITTDVDNTDIRLSSYAIDGGNPHVGYFAHLIGGEERGVYIPGAFEHVDATGQTGNYLSNLNKVKSSIKIKDANGVDIPFDLFPYDVVITPYSPSSQTDGITGTDMLGFGAQYAPEHANENNVFTAVLVAEYQTINDTVFIHYPSKDYLDGTINLKDYDVYNPVPIMKEQVDITDASGNVEATTGSFTMTKNGIGKSNTLYIWHGSLDV